MSPSRPPPTWMLAGYVPHLIVGDGATMQADNGPFDRVHDTGAVAEVPTNGGA